MIEGFDESMELGSVVESFKDMFEIDKPNSELSDEEIKKVCRAIGELSPDTTYGDDGEIIFGNQGTSWMVTTTLYFFPGYWERYGLAQFN
jgi:hypothetical protein